MKAPHNLCASAALALAAALASLPAHALDVVLSNDDGCTAPGLTAVRSALLAAGHRVLTVAPAANQSGSGAAYAIPDGSAKLIVEDRNGDGSLYCVHRVKRAYVAGTALDASNANYIGTGSPVDATLLALKLVAAERGFKPDVVVSGANFGENLSVSVPHSGTVMNAVTAARNGVPAIAVSVGVKLAERNSGFASTFASFPKAADLVTRLIATLDAARPAGEALLPPGAALSVNYPALAAGEQAKPVRFTVVGSTDNFGQAYSRGADGSVAIGIAPLGTEAARLAGLAETPAFNAGHVTVSLIKTDFRPTPLERGLFNKARPGVAALQP